MPRARIGTFIQAYDRLSIGPFPVDSFTLFRSHLGSEKAHYEALVEYPLEPAGGRRIGRSRTEGRLAARRRAERGSSGIREKTRSARGRQQRRRAVGPAVAAADEAQHPHAGGDAGAHAGLRILDDDAVARAERPSCAAAKRNRSGAGLPCATISAENRWGSTNGSSPVSDRVSRILASRPDDATQRGTRRPASTSRTPAIGRSSARKAAASRRRSRSRKSAGSGWPHSASMRAHHRGQADAGVARQAVLGRQREADRHQLARQHPRRDDLGIDEDAVAIEDDEARGVCVASGPAAPMARRLTGGAVAGTMPAVAGSAERRITWLAAHRPQHRRRRRLA